MDRIGCGLTKIENKISIVWPTRSWPLMFVYQYQTNCHNLTKFFTDMSWFMRMVTSQHVLVVVKACLHTHKRTSGAESDWDTLYMQEIVSWTAWILAQFYFCFYFLSSFVICSLFSDSFSISHWNVSLLLKIINRNFKYNDNM